jgi:putative addiction module CopG family antidote
MHVKLSEQLEEYLQSMVATGLYGSTSEFIRDLIRKHMEENQKLHNMAFYNAIRAGDEDIAFGKTEAFTSELMKGIKQQAKKNLENGTLTNSPEALPE